MTTVAAAWPTSVNRITLRHVVLMVLFGSMGLALTAQAASDSHFAYTVQQGDTLITLGDRLLTHPTTWRELARLNRIAHPRRIPVGSVIQIPVRLLKSQQVSASVIATKGNTLRIGTDTATAPVKSGETLGVNEEIQTGNDGFVTIRLADGSDIRIQPNSHVRLERAQHFEAAGFFKTRIKLLKGRVESLVKRSSVAPPSLEIQTPQATMGVRGTEFRTAIGLADTPVSSAEVISGTVMANQLTPVHAGHGVRVENDQAPKVVQLLPAPVFKPVALQRQEREVVRLPVSVLSGARAYRLQLARDAQFLDMYTETVSESADIRLLNVPDGTYLAKVRAIDAQGLEGMPTTAQVVVKAHPAPPLTMQPPVKAKVRADNITFEWTSNPEAATYRLQVAKDTTSGQPLAWEDPLVDSGPLTATQTQLGLPPGDYQWRMASIRANGDAGPWGDPQSLQVRALPPNMAAPVVSRTQVQLGWSGEPGQTFELQVSRQPGFAHLMYTLSTAEPAATIKRPEDGGRLYVRYRAIDADGFEGPFAPSQVIELPRCLKDSTGQCLRNSDGETVTSWPSPNKAATRGTARP